MGIMLSITAIAQYESYATLADLAQDKLHNSFRSSNGSYYIENSGTSNTYFHYWWNAHALDVLVMAAMPCPWEQRAIQWVSYRHWAL